MSCVLCLFPPLRKTQRAFCIFALWWRICHICVSTLMLTRMYSKLGDSSRKAWINSPLKKHSSPAVWYKVKVRSAHKPIYHVSELYVKKRPGTKQSVKKITNLNIVQLLTEYISGMKTGISVLASYCKLTCGERTASVMNFLLLLGSSEVSCTVPEERLAERQF